MMIGLDTNIIIRIIVRDDEDQLDLVNQFLNKNRARQFFISNLVILEINWVLESVYDYSKEQIIDALLRLMDIEDFVFEAEDELQQAIENYKMYNVDFEDCLIGLFNKKNGCEYTVTFDKAAATLTQFKKL